MTRPLAPTLGSEGRAAPVRRPTPHNGYASPFVAPVGALGIAAHPGERGWILAVQDLARGRPGQPVHQEMRNSPRGSRLDLLHCESQPGDQAIRISHYQDIRASCLSIGICDCFGLRPLPHAGAPQQLPVREGVGVPGGDMVPGGTAVRTRTSPWDKNSNGHRPMIAHGSSVADTGGLRGHLGGTMST